MNLINRIMKETAVKILSKVTDSVEYRCVKWTTYRNFNSWYLNWEHDLEELGFDYRYDAGDLIIPKNQLQRIINVDESCLSMDRSKGRRGGRTRTVFYSPNLPLVGRPTGKSGLTTTHITVSTSAEESIPPHFQISTKEKYPKK